MLSTLLPFTVFNVMAQGPTSTFDTDDEGWTVVGDASGGVMYRSEGGNPGGYIEVTESPSGSIMRWVAPPKFLGNQSVHYKGSLQFDRRQSSTANQLEGTDDVILEGAGLRLVFDAIGNPGTEWTKTTVPLDERIGWTSAGSGLSPTSEEMQAVLADLTLLQIRAEFYYGRDTDGLDNVELRAGSVLDGPPISNFDLDAEFWRARGDVRTLEHVQTGGNPSGFVQLRDERTGEYMYWIAPPKFLGDQSSYYGGSLAFDQRQSTASSQVVTEDDIILKGTALDIAYNLPQNPGVDWTSVSVQLSENAGWTVLSTSTPPTREQFQQVLANLAGLEIRAEYSTASDYDDLDNVVLSIDGPNSPPIFTSVPDTVASVGLHYGYPIKAIDPDGDELAFEAHDQPVWLTLTDNGDATATLTGTPTLRDIGYHAVVVRVRDTFGNIADQSFTLRVTLQSPRRVTLTLNTATVPDTIGTTSLIEVRGSIDGTAPDTLPDGNIIDWTDRSTLELINVGGDYWHIDFQIADSIWAFKFFSEQLDNAGLNGWEAPPDPTIEAAEGDTTLPLHFFEAISEWRGMSGDRGDYNWRPFESKPDSVAIWFRVYMCTNAARQQGYTSDGSVNVAVRGGDLSGQGPLEWDQSKLELTRESSTEGQAAYDLWSGVVYFARSLVGETQSYKFVVEADGVVGWEHRNDRTFRIPASDSTLSWVYFDDALAVGGGCKSVGQPPAFVSVPATVATVGLEYAYVVSASDPDGDTVTIDAITLPVWLAISGVGDGTATISGTPSTEDIGPHQVSLRASDGNGNFAVQEYAVAVTAPHADLEFSRPLAGDHYLPGRRDSILWTGGEGGDVIRLEYSSDGGDSYTRLVETEASEGRFYWDVPAGELTPRARIRLTNVSEGLAVVESDLFRVKPFVITRVDANGNYIVYDPNNDRWPWDNDSLEDLWPREWWQQFQYRSGVDPFTGQPYVPWITRHFDWRLENHFQRANSRDFPDWISWVNTFGRAACYTSENHYVPLCVERWANLTREVGRWRGSCFGIAISNALVFERKEEFFTRYPSFPAFDSPLFVGRDQRDDYIPVVTELWTHQVGNPHSTYQSTIGLRRTPSETIRDLKRMLRSDITEIQTLSFNSNGERGGSHAVVVYRLEQDQADTSLYHVYVYDNEYPDITHATISVDADDGVGTWRPTYGLEGWGGDKWFYLRDPAKEYLQSASLVGNPKSGFPRSPFMLEADELQIFGGGASEFVIEDQFHRRSGTSAVGIVMEIPGSTPIVIDDSEPRPPIGYTLPAGHYQISLKYTRPDTVNMTLFAGNRVFNYERTGGGFEDNLLYDGGLRISQPGTNPRSVALRLIMVENEEQRVLSVRSLEMSQGDSLRLQDREGGRVAVSYFGNGSSYAVSLESVGSHGRGHFTYEGISISANTSHTLVPAWAQLGSSDLPVLVDVGDDGIVEDTLLLAARVNQAPSQPAILTPGLNQYFLLAGDPQEFITVSWWPSEDADEDIIRYWWSLHLVPDLSDKSVWTWVGEATEIPLQVGHLAQILRDAGAFVGDRVRLYHRVVAHDGWDEVSSDTLAFVLELGQVSTAAEESQFPREFSLDQNYPNPFNPATTITYALPRPADVTLAVYDVLGRRVRDIVAGARMAGRYEVSFDAQDLPSGVYFYRLRAGDFVAIRRMVIVR